MTPKIQVIYSCAACGLKDVTLDVDARGDEDINTWMTRLQHALARDHKRRNGWCHPKALTEVKIPFTGATQLGGPAVN